MANATADFISPPMPWIRVDTLEYVPYVPPYITLLPTYVPRKVSIGMFGARDSHY